MLVLWSWTEIMSFRIYFYGLSVGLNMENWIFFIVNCWLFSKKKMKNKTVLLKLIELPDKFNKMVNLKIFVDNLQKPLNLAFTFNHQQITPITISNCIPARSIKLSGNILSYCIYGTFSSSHKLITIPAKL